MRTALLVCLVVSINVLDVLGESHLSSSSSSSSSLDLQPVAMTERDKSRYTEGSPVFVQPIGGNFKRCFTNELHLLRFVFPGESRVSQRIVGGSTAAISQYPYAASLLHSWNSVIFRQLCGGTIITTTAVLSAAQCFV
ncbi:Trypsin CFT-1 [Eumeta japonica]|uniref:Trypsin CFT-1 n=1 Tax=Eumeta variegata TaxID=151549 RepID=A0A4C1WEK5_EUMVA|nr:Trypsin CFT-1 [Eumeta japonica]